MIQYLQKDTATEFKGIIVEFLNKPKSTYWTKPSLYVKLLFDHDCIFSISLRNKMTLLDINASFWFIPRKKTLRTLISHVIAVYKKRRMTTSRIFSLVSLEAQFNTKLMLNYQQNFCKHKYSTFSMFNSKYLVLSNSR